MNLKEWRDYEKGRQEIISRNRSRLMSRPQMPPLPVPTKLPRPQVVQLFDKVGDYIGTYPDMTEPQARDAAEADGYNVGQSKWVDAH